MFDNSRPSPCSKVTVTVSAGRQCLKEVPCNGQHALSNTLQSATHLSHHVLCSFMCSHCPLLASLHLRPPQQLHHSSIHYTISSLLPAPPGFLVQYHCDRACSGVLLRPELMESPCLLCLTTGNAHATWRPGLHAFQPHGQDLRSMRLASMLWRLVGCPRCRVWSRCKQCNQCHEHQHQLTLHTRAFEQALRTSTAHTVHMCRALAGS